MHHYQDLITLFDRCFAEKYNTRLIKGGDEPLYLPADDTRPYHAIYFAHGFFSSALHECAHWLLAGKNRRQLIDYGYWYAPDGRTAEQQLLFQQVEVKPQALELILATACNHPFRVSIDNLNGVEADTEGFKQAVYQQAVQYCQQGLPKRAAVFTDALCEFYGSSLDACSLIKVYSKEVLGFTAQPT
ncbi:elongation factor P hydroxylase [Legionella dresdenensis]|uniref:Elongation factor P hydroxylase n=1 Tax=Legionella dresdenensis TaxID=450200 RepID=A0ABV8CDU1_9GAMM